MVLTVGTSITRITVSLSGYLLPLDVNGLLHWHNIIDVMDSFETVSCMTHGTICFELVLSLMGVSRHDI